MDKILPFAKQLGRAKWLPPLVILLALGILGGTIYLGTLKLRDSIRHQILGRDAEVLDGVARLEQLGADSPAHLSQQLQDSAGQLALALRLSRLRDGVLATRLFDSDGEFVAAVPVAARATRLDPVERARMEKLLPMSRYEPEARLQDYFLSPSSSEVTRLPLLSVLIPLHAEGQTNLLAVAELIQDGTGTHQELARLDRNLARQALTAFGLAGGILGVALAWAFLRLQRLTRKLQEHAASLRRANQELALSAKTSALGAVTAHVIHGLTSPLTSLQNFVATHAGHDGEWQDAMTNTRRMQALVGEVVRVLGEQTNGTQYDLPLSELAQVLAARTEPAAAALGVEFEAWVTAEGALSNRRANLVLLILDNLVQNALQATPRGKSVHLSISPSSVGVVCEVSDEGPGLPAAVREDLFAPCRSTKPGGNGIGLALSQHLARHLGGELQLVRSTSTGSSFALLLPAVLFEPDHEDEVQETAG